MSVELAGLPGLHEENGYSSGAFEEPFTGTVTVPGIPLGITDEQGRYVPRKIAMDDLGDEQISAAIDSSFVEVEEGNLVEGTVVKVDREEVLVDIGFKSEGVIPLRELSIRNDVLPEDVVKVGEKIEALVLQKEDKDGRLVLSKKRAQYERAWSRIEGIKARDGRVHGMVIEIVKGGLIVDIGLRGFLPASLVDIRRIRELHPYLGQEMEAKIIELDRNRNNVVLSRRALMEQDQREQRVHFLADLKPGDRVRGVVSSIVHFGVFVDIGGMDGLIHVSELSWKHVDHPSAILSAGDEIEVEILEVDPDKERISLSLKATQTDPWHDFGLTHQAGELVYGRITKLVPFGAFVQVGDGIEGLVHISEMASHRVDTPDQVVSVGEELWVKITDIDPQKHRISLSIKQAAEGGEVSEEYREAFGEHAFDDEGNYIGYDFTEFTPETEAQAAWADVEFEAGDKSGGVIPTPSLPVGENDIEHPGPEVVGVSGGIHFAGEDIPEDTANIDESEDHSPAGE